MANKLVLYAVSDDKSLVQSQTNGGGFSLPPLVQNDVTPISLTILEKNPAGGITDPFSIDRTQSVVRVGIVTPNSVAPTVHSLGSLVYQSPAGTYFGSLSLGTQEIATLLGSSTSVQSTFEIEVTGAGNSVFTIQKPVTISADGLKTGTPINLSGSQSFYDASTSDSLFLKRSGAATAQGDWNVSITHGAAATQAKFTRDTDLKVFSFGSWTGAGWSDNSEVIARRGDVLLLTGGTLTGEAHHAANPTHGNALTRKSYVDAKILDAGTLTGTLVLARDPVLNMEAATKQFVLANASSPPLGSGVIHEFGTRIAADVVYIGSLVGFRHLHETSQVLEQGGPLYFSFQRVRETALTGIDTTTQAVIGAGDNVLSGLGKLEAAKVSKSSGTFTSPVRFSPGTAGAPAITIASDLDTGIFWPGPGNTISIATDGGELVRFGGGAVTIGAATPVATLGVVGAANQAHLVVRAHSSQTVDLQQWQNSAETVLAAISRHGALVISNDGLFGAPKGVKITATNSAGYAAVELTNNSGGSGFLKMLGSGGSPVHALVLENAGAADVCIRTDGIDRVRVREGGDVEVTGLRLMPGGGFSEGALWQDSAQKSLQTFVAGIEQSLSGVIFTGIADKVVTNTTAETSIVPTGPGGLTLPANFWVAGKTIRVTLIGLLRSKSSGPGTLTVRVKLGSTVIASTGGFALEASLSDTITNI